MDDQGNPKKTILVLDDEVDLQQLIKIALVAKGYHVETGNNGLEGLEKLKTLTPHLIILDINMPKMGGMEFYRKICYGGNQSKFPCLVLTARANLESLFKDFDIDGFIAKPFEIDALLKKVEAIISSRYGAGRKIKVSEGKQPPKVCIVENNPEALAKIREAFLNVGYTVHSAASGTEAVERIPAAAPDVALVKLELDDIPGDAVIAKLKEITKTQNIKFILYREQSAIDNKAGIDYVVGRSGTDQIIDAVNNVLKMDYSP